MSLMASQITSVSMFAKAFIQVEIKENIKALRHWPLWGESTGDRWSGPCEGNPPVTGGFPSQRASNVENDSIWWRHHMGVFFEFSVWSSVPVIMVCFDNMFY